MKLQTLANQRFIPDVEMLEGRELPSVTVFPGRINLRSAGPGNGAMKIVVISDTEIARTLLSSGNALVITVTDANGTVKTLGTPLRVLQRDANGDGVLDQVLKFRRRELAGLAAGEATVTATDSAGQSVETGTVLLARRGRPGHAGHGAPTKLLAHV